MLKIEYKAVSFTARAKYVPAIQIIFELYGLAVYLLSRIVQFLAEWKVSILKV